MNKYNIGDTIIVTKRTAPYGPPHVRTKGFVSEIFDDDHVVMVSLLEGTYTKFGSGKINIDNIEPCDEDWLVIATKEILKK